MKKQKNLIDYRIVLAVVGSITIIEVVALLKGVNGLLLASVLAILGAIVGITLPQIKTK